MSSLRREGQVVGRVAVLRDISGRKQAEAALRASEERFRLLVEGVQDYAIYLLDPEGRIVTWNTGAERIKGYTAAEVLGGPFSRFFPPGRAGAWHTGEAPRAGRPRRALCRRGLACPQGRLTVLGECGHYGAPRDADGQLRGFAKVTRDITERRAAEQALAAAHDRLRAPRGRAHRRPAGAQHPAGGLAPREGGPPQRDSSPGEEQPAGHLEPPLPPAVRPCTNPAVHDFLRESERRIGAMALVHETLYQSGDFAQFRLAAVYADPQSRSSLQRLRRRPPAVCRAPGAGRGHPPAGDGRSLRGLILQ